MRRIHVITWAVLGLLTAGGVPAAQEPATGPVSRTVLVDVWVRDAQGLPVASLEADDFEVQFDGRPRRVTEARFIDYTGVVSAGASPADAMTPADLPGRTVGVVVDDLSFQVGNDDAAGLRAAAAQWISELQPSDRVAVFHSGDAGRSRAISQRPSDAAMHVREATADRPSAEGGDAEFARERRTLDQVEAIAKAISWLAVDAGPRVLVVLSGGVAMSADATRYLATSTGLARDAGISTYFVAPALAEPATPAAIPAATWDSVPAEGPAVLAAGLDQLAVSMSGRVLRAQGTPEGALAEIARELTGFYRLEVDVPPGDVLPRSLPVTVSVRPAGLVVRSAARVKPPSNVTTPRTMEERRRDILAGVDAAGEIEFDASTALSRDPSVPDQLQLVVSLAVPPDLPAPVRAWFGLLDADGTVRFGSTDVAEAADGPRRASIAIGLAPGWHRLTLVVEDGQGRLGSIDRAVHARLHSIGGFVAADPRVIWRGQEPGWQMLGGETLPEEAVAVATVFELYPGEPGREPPPLPIRLEHTGGGELGTQMLTPTTLDYGWRLSSEVQVGGLAPGEYVFRLDTTPLDASAAPLVLRFRKDAAATASAAAPPPPPLPDRADLLNLFRAGVRNDWPRFAPDELLAPDLLMPQLKAVAGSRPLPAALARATGDEWWTALRAAGKASTTVGLAARGLGALHDGDATAAVSYLRDAVSASPTSAALRRLLGIAYAASGRDDAAAGVWSLAMNDGGGHARWSLAYAEALGRVGEYPGALQALRQIPGEPSVRVAHRIIDALIVVGRMDEAMDALLAWEAAEGRDEPTARLAFYLIALRYAAVLEPGADATTVDEFRRVAEAYVTGGGEYAEMVGPWIQSTAGIAVK